ncbi:tyrosine-type recombinase/integrase [Streptomyces sp. AMCC400023]|uniref:tyrosine-type recombinase/integrase n=1 Tax=Streptomyces sp. AMCC400023 TaxID=2056258 RepID=UPI001F3C1DC8|nr:site-specific integrase [Streptomyces sp. AMCC400023]UJV42903.1 site-specific integrase [Streptomyces sp. AMCC400023]
MASVHPRRNGAGDVTAWLVKWRLGGARTGAQQTERFDPDDEGREAAEVFKEAVNDAGQQWPLGWVKGQGMVSPDAEDTGRYRFGAYALNMFELKTGIQPQYRRDCVRDLERWIIPTFGNCDVRSPEHFTGDTVSAWVRVLEQTMVHKGQAPKDGTPKLRPMSPKTIRNLHGLLASVLEKATREGLRERNPCALTRLPRVDDDGADGEDIEFLTPEEVNGLISCMEQRSDQLLALVKYGTGMRWSEVTALGPVCLVDWGTAKPALRVMRSWKRDGESGYFLGMPKSKKGRRTVRVSSTVVEAVEELGGADNDRPDRLYFTRGPGGERLHYSTFYDRWQRAVRRAKAAGLMPSHKSPTPHDLRHSHAAVLLSEGRGLEYVKVRLGHESIMTTSNTYGHLLPSADDDAMDTIDRSLRGGLPASPGRLGAGVPVPAPRGVEGGPKVHVVAFPGSGRAAFWRGDLARLVADAWRLEHRAEPRVEEIPAADWAARHGGLGDVHEGMPGRVRLFEIGPAAYGPDGTEQADRPDAHAMRSRWVWEWQDGYTSEAALMRVEHRPGLPALTEAYAWGTDERAVRAAYVKGRAKALQRCAQHPAVVRSG